MTELVKPIPSSPLHGMNDDMLKDLLQYLRRDMIIRNAPTVVAYNKQKIDDIFKVLGYRCALEYIERYES